MISIVVNQAQEYLDTANPITVVDSFNLAKNPQINLFENKFSPVLIAYSNGTTGITAQDMSRYLNLVVQRISWVTVTFENGDQHIEKNFETFPTVPCGNLTEEELATNYDYMGVDNYFAGLLKDYAMCIRFPEDLTIEGSFSDDSSTMLTIKVLPCALPSGCATFEEMSLVNFNFLQPAVNFNASNMMGPLELYATDSDIYYVHPGIKQVFTGQVMQKLVMDYTGLIPSWKERSKAFELGIAALTVQYRSNTTSCTADDLAINDNPNCQPYLELSLSSGNHVTVNKRSYQSATETLGNIGGINQVVWVILIFLYSPINDYQRKHYLLSKIYPLLGEKDIGLGNQKDLIKDNTSALLVPSNTGNLVSELGKVEELQSPGTSTTLAPIRNIRKKSRKDTMVYKGSFLMNFFAKQTQEIEVEEAPSPLRSSKSILVCLSNQDG